MSRNVVNFKNELFNKLGMLRGFLCSCNSDHANLIIVQHNDKIFEVRIKEIDEDNIDCYHTDIEDMVASIRSYEGE